MISSFFLLTDVLIVKHTEQFSLICSVIFYSVSVMLIFFFLHYNSNYCEYIQFMGFMLHIAVVWITLVPSELKSACLK